MGRAQERSRNMKGKKMTKPQCIEMFKSSYGKCPPWVTDSGHIDGPMRDQAWNDFVDGLEKDNMVSSTSQHWTHPFNHNPKTPY